MGAVWMSQQAGRPGAGGRVGVRSDIRVEKEEDDQQTRAAAAAAVLQQRAGK